LNQNEQVHIIITPEALNPHNIIASVKNPASGAVVSFEGTVRNHNAGRRVLTVEYEAYEAMAYDQLEILACEALSRWALTGVAISHRTGLIPIGEAAVVIAVSSVHRREAFEACSHIIDRLKNVVPIWKKETTEEGSGWIGESTLFKDN
jgi:molybdopterin synthase catalytic subunit